MQWAAGSGDFYQIHYDKDFAIGTGLPGLIVHGALKNAFLGQLVHDWAGNTARVKSYGCSYRGMDYPNEDILCKGVVTKKYEEDGEKLVDLDIWTENPRARRPRRARRRSASSRASRRHETSWVAQPSPDFAGRVRTMAAGRPPRWSQ